MKKEKWVHAASVLSALVLMALPWSVNDYYMQAGVNGGATHEVERHCSYFQIDPLMNGHVGPFITAVLTVFLAVIVLLMFFIKGSKPLATVSTVLSGAAVVTSILCVVPHGIDGLTIAGLTVLLLMVYSLVISVQYLIGYGFADYEDDDDE